MIKKIKYHIKKLKYLWKDNKVIMLKHMVSIIVCGFNKFLTYFEKKRNDEKVRKIIREKKKLFVR